LQAALVGKGSLSNSDHSQAEALTGLDASGRWKRPQLGLAGGLVRTYTARALGERGLESARHVLNLSRIVCGIHPDARNKPHVARRLPTKQFTGPPPEGTVARGRSVDVVLHDAEPEIAGYSAEEKRYIMRAQTRCAGPGEVVVLPAEEIAWLRSRGFLVDPDAELAERSSTGMPSPAA